MGQHFATCIFILWWSQINYHDILTQTTFSQLSQWLITRSLHSIIWARVRGLKIVNEKYIMEQLIHKIRTEEEQCREKVVEIVCPHINNKIRTVTPTLSQEQTAETMQSSVFLFWWFVLLKIKYQRNIFMYIYIYIRIHLIARTLDCKESEHCVEDSRCHQSVVKCS